MRFAFRTAGSLDAFEARLADVASGGASQPMREAVAKEAEAIVDTEFAGQRDPQGGAWSARVPPTGSWPILDKTGAMKASRKAAPTSTGATVTIAAPAQFHQKGTKRMVARPLVPGDARSEEWQTRIGDAAAKALREKLGGAA